ncbi:hypothetical protein [Burkholderia ubonensis]|uniref:hypothetical protein n=1 Tax=Burkholderia ubonensis TaxID=101571 RepID=UPI0007521369|nr:hypothetical protein [Burkholderia ubonensis]
MSNPGQELFREDFENTSYRKYYPGDNFTTSNKLVCSVGGDPQEGALSAEVAQLPPDAPAASWGTRALGVYRQVAVDIKFPQSVPAVSFFAHAVRDVDGHQVTVFSDQRTVLQIIPIVPSVVWPVTPYQYRAPAGQLVGSIRVGTAPDTSTPALWVDNIAGSS